MTRSRPLVVRAAEAPLRAKGSNYPEPFATGEPVTCLEIGDCTAGDTVSNPDDELVARLVGGAWQFQRKDGTPW